MGERVIVTVANDDVCRRTSELLKIVAAEFDTPDRMATTYTAVSRVLMAMTKTLKDLGFSEEELTTFVKYGCGQVDEDMEDLKAKA